MLLKSDLISGPLSSFFLIICKRMDEKSQNLPLARQFGPIFGFFGYCRREYFDTLKSFCYFLALDMAPTWAVSGLFRVEIRKRHLSRTFFNARFSISTNPPRLAVPKLSKEGTLSVPKFSQVKISKRSKLFWTLE